MILLDSVSNCVIDVIKLAASASPPQKSSQAEKLNFQAIIKSAASAASAKTNSWGTKLQGSTRLADDRGRDALLELGLLDLVFRGAALATDLIMA